MGSGPRAIWAPLPPEGTSRTDEVGVTWWVAASERPDVAYRTEYCRPDRSEWTVRYVFEDEPRALRYFEATTCSPPPESPFTGEPTIAHSTATGCRKLSGDA